ncbi:CPBP family intramembrane glutamic endopeptidase [Pelagicoccus sp. SDUM812003]|uniref:CPBP family intramembrane glutamic endopeptidase n=1 Tax=Pelagicoccus sp. SDUM812003 TaxID=3041267 RepID=UPI00280E8627|nr:CPBP family intramembrane glutamic endopeptidase [Pelagicoccus sp. SDUM812003]MDQ8204107.1 CPBP family intramembrane metalloprotease [Pelagicoccus sp. SDUM812003]
MTRFTKTFPILCFIGLSYGLSWLCWLPIRDKIQSNPFESEPWVFILLLLGGYGPSVAALILASLDGGASKVVALLKKFAIFKVGFRWYAVALLYGPLAMAISVGIYAATGGTIGYVHYPAFLFIPVMFVAASIFGPLAEELGFRGYALPLLYERYGFFLSSVALGAIHTFWHTPLFWSAEGSGVSGAPVTLASVGLYFLTTTSLSFIFTWVFKNTRGSVFLAFLVHLSANGSNIARGFILPELDDAAARLINDYRAFVLLAMVVCGAAFIRIVSTRSR